MNYKSNLINVSGQTLTVKLYIDGSGGHLEFGQSMAEVSERVGNIVEI